MTLKDSASYYLANYFDKACLWDAHRCVSAATIGAAFVGVSNYFHRQINASVYYSVYHSVRTTSIKQIKSYDT